MTIKNRLLNTVKCCLALLTVTLFAPCTNLSADAEVAKKSDLVTFSNQNLRGQDKNYQAVDSWTPYFTWIGNVQDQTKTTFTQASIGLGFLYASDVRGNPITHPQQPGQADNGFGIDGNRVGKLSYNRVPVYEWTYGYKVFSWMDVLVSVQSQCGVNVQTDVVTANRFAIDGNNFFGWNAIANQSLYYQFRSQLDLNSVMLKLNFELPWVLVWKNWMHAFHLGAGVGPGWQSWTDNRVLVRAFGSVSDTVPFTYVNMLNQKYSANCVFQIDSGVRIKPATPCADISILFGCKYNQWGQARSIGKLQDQGAWNTGLLQPYSIKVLYSFVPYLGFQWNF